MSPVQLVFTDETWAKTSMTRLRGRARSGLRLVEKVPHGHWKTTTLIGALDASGMRCSMLVDGAVNTEIFTAFVKQILVPTLKAGQLVVMDNLSSHKSPTIREAIEGVCARLLYLPPYSPDLNPIQGAFSKIKQRLRSLSCRSADILWQTMRSVLNQVTASDAKGWFKYCGYGTVDTCCTRLLTQITCHDLLELICLKRKGSVSKHATFIDDATGSFSDQCRPDINL